MQPDFYTYTVEMKKYLEKQDRRIMILEKEIAALKDRIRNQGAQRAVTVEKIEYKFDQLKIEKLDGTLNIGVNPSDIDDLIKQTNSEQHNNPLSSAERDMVTNQISAEITGFIERELSEIIAQQESHMGISFEGQYNQFIKEDLYKQLPERIEYYLVNNPYVKELERGNDYASKIIEQIKTDISQAVGVFLQNIQANMSTS